MTPAAIIQPCDPPPLPPARDTWPSSLCLPESEEVPADESPSDFPPDEPWGAESDGVLWGAEPAGVLLSPWELPAALASLPPLFSLFWKGSTYWSSPALWATAVAGTAVSDAARLSAASRETARDEIRIRQS